MNNNMKTESKEHFEVSKDQVKTQKGSQKSDSEPEVEQSAKTEGNQKNTGYQFINEPLDEWPQWSVGQGVEEDYQSQIDPRFGKEEDIFKFMVKYNRGMGAPLRKKMFPFVFKFLNKLKAENNLRPEEEKFDEKTELNKRLKGWRRLLVPDKQL